MIKNAKQIIHDALKEAQEKDLPMSEVAALIEQRMELCIIDSIGEQIKKTYPKGVCIIPAKEYAELVLELSYLKSQQTIRIEGRKLLSDYFAPRAQQLMRDHLEDKI